MVYQPMKGNMVYIKVADEVWVSTALLHRKLPDRGDFSIGEIVAQADAERATGAPLRPGVQVHAYLHCVANKAPNPGRYRMLVETSKGRRRLFRPGDPCHPLRLGGKDAPRDDELPPAYRELLAWYRQDYLGDAARRAVDPILALRGVGRELWADETADDYVRRLREGWL